MVDFSVRGSGPDLLMLAGGLSSWEALVPLADLMSDDRLVWTVDTPGRGLSPWTPGRYRLEDIADSMADFVDNEVGPTAVYGHSYGGAIAAVLAARHPSLVTSLALGDAPLDREWLMDFRRRNNFTEQVREYVARMPNIDPDLVAANLDRAEETYAVLEPAVLLPQITCPVLYLQADPALNSATTSEKLVAALAFLPQGELVPMPGLSHGLHDEDPAAVAAVLARLF